MHQEIIAEFDRGHMTEIMQLMLKHFRNNNYSLWHLFRDEQRAVLSDITRTAMSEITITLRHVFDRHVPVMQFMHSLNHPSPRLLQHVAALIIHDDLKTVLLEAECGTEKLRLLTERIESLGVEIRTDDLALDASACVNRLVSMLANDIQNRTLMDQIAKLLQLLERLHCDLDIWEAQNQIFTLTKQCFRAEQNRATEGDPRAQAWVKDFAALGTLLKIRID